MGTMEPKSSGKIARKSEENGKWWTVHAVEGINVVGFLLDGFFAISF